jgi:hypothetical protein
MGFGVVEKLVHVSVLSPNDMAMSAFLNRVAEMGGYFVCSQQIITQAKSSIMSANGKAQPEIKNIHTIQIPKAKIEELTRKMTGDPKVEYSEFALVPSEYFFSK